MEKSEFKKLSHSERWDVVKKLKSVLWYCLHCGCMIDGGKKPERMFMGERHCGNCDGMLTRRTNGGQGDPCYYFPKRKDRMISVARLKKLHTQIGDLKEMLKVAALMDRPGLGDVKECCISITARDNISIKIQNVEKSWFELIEDHKGDDSFYKG